MKLVLKQTHLGVWLHTEDGTPLPQQMSVRVDSEPNDVAKVTVVFALGEDVVLSPPDVVDRDTAIFQTVLKDGWKEI